jgi:hypothetical protein
VPPDLREPCHFTRARQPAAPVLSRMVERVLIDEVSRPGARRTLPTVATKLNEVFGIAQRVSQASCVDRGRLDERLRYLLGTGRHIAIHGDSKQGKSWRNSVLDADDTLAVQCLVNTTPEALFNEALGMLGIRAELKKTKTNDLQGTLDLSAAGELGFKLLAKGKAEAKASGGAKRSTATDTEPIGQTVADPS